jgi:hypothetical protein
LQNSTTRPGVSSMQNRNLIATFATQSTQIHQYQRSV